MCTNAAHCGDTVRLSLLVLDPAVRHTGKGLRPVCNGWLRGHRASLSPNQGTVTRQRRAGFGSLKRNLPA
jgi:hypothetical protein